MDFFFKEKRVVVTGGLGLIGSHICDLLIEKQANVVAIDNKYRGKLEYLKYPKKAVIIKKDILDLSSNDVVQDAEIVFHVASKVLGIGYSARNHQDMLFHNDQMTNSLFTYLDNFKSIKQLIVVSSSCVYDDNLESTFEDLGDEGLPEIANLGYGLAKRFLEQKAQLWARENNVKLIIVRPSNIYGERYSWAGSFSQGLPSLVKKVLDNKGEVEIWGSGEQRRNYVYALDCAKLILSIANLNLEYNQVFNIGTSKTVSLKELVEKMCQLYDINPKLSFRRDMPEGRIIKSTEESKLRKFLPNFDDDFITLDEGLLKMHEWYTRNFNQLRSSDYE